MPLPQQNQTATLRPVAAADIPTLIAIGRRIWQEHYVPIIGQTQVDYMTAQRFTPEYLSRYLPVLQVNSDITPDMNPARWLDVLETDGVMVGYCSYSLGTADNELKLEQLYLLPELHGRGFGGQMMRHIEQQARTLQRPVLWLTVNKHNSGSIAVYNKAGFSVREEAVFDIGNGYVMDDYVMEKKLS
jgi:ribosomal protein S18 acetylase RimI-like enzyme